MMNLAVDEVLDANAPVDPLSAVSADSASVFPKPEPADLTAPNPVDTDPNPCPNAFGGESFSLLSFSGEAVALIDPNPLDTAPNPEPNVDLPAAADPNDGTFAVDPNTAGALASPSFSPFASAGFEVTKLTLPKIPPPPPPPEADTPPHFLLALTIFRPFNTSSEARWNGWLRLPPSSFKSSSSSGAHSPSGCSSLFSWMLERRFLLEEASEGREASAETFGWGTADLGSEFGSPFSVDVLW